MYFDDIFKKCYNEMEKEAMRQHDFLVQTPFKMVTAVIRVLKTTHVSFVEHMSGFYFLSFLLFIIATIRAAKAIIIVRLSKTVMFSPFQEKPSITWHHLLS